MPSETHRVEDADRNHMPSSHVSLTVHIVFSTKDRRRLITPEIAPRLFAYMGGIIKGMDAVPLGINGVEDHAHVIAGLRSKHRVDYFVRDLKADSSEWFHKEFSKLFAWQKGYGAFSVSPTAIEVVKEYVRKQPEHHRKEDFKTEYRTMLEKSGIPFDEKYLW